MAITQGQIKALRQEANNLKSGIGEAHHHKCRTDCKADTHRRCPETRSALNSPI